MLYPSNCKPNGGITMLSKAKVFAGLALTTTIIGTFASSAGATVFETFYQMPFNKTFSTHTDPLSGITFSNPISPDGNKFTVQQTEAWSALPDLTPGDMLIAQTTLPGSPISNDFGFTMSFASPVAQLNMDMAYEVTNFNSGGAMLLEGFDTTGKLVATQTQTFAYPSNPFGPSAFEDHLTLAATSPSISSVQVIPTNLADGFTNISYDMTTAVPEPSCIAIFALTPLMMQRRRRMAQ
jgi:hypothetical protein